MPQVEVEKESSGHSKLFVTKTLFTGEISIMRYKWATFDPLVQCWKISVVFQLESICWRVFD